MGVVIGYLLKTTRTDVLDESGVSHQVRSLIDCDDPKNVGKCITDPPTATIATSTTASFMCRSNSDCQDKGSCPPKTSNCRIVEGQPNRCWTGGYMGK